MYPELWKIPGFGWSIKSYGFMLMAGFLVSIWFAMRRATRVKADPDLVLNIGFVSLIFGVGGARLFYVIHYWKTSFATAKSPLWEAINISAGGLEYYGGLIGAILGAVVYLAFFAKFYGPGDEVLGKPTHKASVRLYLDLVAPSVMLGLAFGRAGCFLNGCCWGGLCTHDHEDSHKSQTQAAQVDHLQQHDPALPWAMTFPFGSPAHIRQWENRQVFLPAELIFTHPLNVNAPFLAKPESLEASPEEIEQPQERLRDIRKRVAQAKERDPDSEETKQWIAEEEAARKAWEAANIEHFTAIYAKGYPSRNDPDRAYTTRTELADLAAQYRSLPVHPAQMYGLINAVLLSVFLSFVFYRRKRHGMVFTLILLLYPITRVILEIVRVDNPHDTGGMTISQAVSVGMFLSGVVLLIMLRRMPLRSVRAVAYVPPVETDKKKDA